MQKIHDIGELRCRPPNINSCRVLHIELLNFFCMANNSPRGKFMAPTNYHHKQDAAYDQHHRHANETYLLSQETNLYFPTHIFQQQIVRQNSTW